MNRILSYMLAATVLTTTVHAASVDQKSGSTSVNRKQLMEERAQQMEKELGLTPDQASKIKSIREKYKEKQKSQMEELKAAKKDLRESMQSDKKGADAQKELSEKFQKVQTLKQGIAQNWFAMGLEIRELLTADQMKKFHDLREKHKHDKDGKSRKHKFHCDDNENIKSVEEAAKK